MEWREVVGFPGYRVSDEGQIKSFRRYPGGRILKPGVSTSKGPKSTGAPGALIVVLRRDGRSNTRKVHHTSFSRLLLVRVARDKRHGISMETFSTIV